MRSLIDPSDIRTRGCVDQSLIMRRYGTLARGPRTVNAPESYTFVVRPRSLGSSPPSLLGAFPIPHPHTRSLIEKQTRKTHYPHAPAGSRPWLRLRVWQPHLDPFHLRFRLFPCGLASLGPVDVAAGEGELDGPISFDCWVM